MVENEATTAEVETTEKVDALVAEAQEVKEAPVKNPAAKPKVQKNEGFKMLPYFENAKVVCACGNTFTTGSTKEEIHVEICSACHPFFTGQEKFVDTEGRVERFKRMEASKQETTKAKKETGKKDNQPKTLKEMLMSLDNK